MKVSELTSSYYFLTTTRRDISNILAKIEINSDNNSVAFSSLSFSNRGTLNKYGVQDIQLPVIGITPSDKPFDDNIVFLTTSQQERTAIGGIRDKKLVLNFNFQATEKYILSESYLPQPKPLNSIFRVLYKILPIRVRSFLFMLFQKTKLSLFKVSHKQTFPKWPADPCIDLLREVCWTVAAQLAKVQVHSPEIKGKKIAIITHDIETGEAVKNFDAIRKAEKKYGCDSSWSLVSNRYEIRDTRIRHLLNDGCEIINHGYTHDGLLPYLSQRDIQSRLRHLTKRWPFLEGKVQGFRSPQLLRNSRLSQQVNKVFKFDLSVPDSEKLSTMGLHTGCCTMFPFYNRQGTLIIPLTMPQDFYLQYVYNYSGENIEVTMKRKIDYVSSCGGVIVALFHPDSYMWRNKKSNETFDKVLFHIKKRGYIFSTPTKVYEEIRSLMCAASA